MVSQEVKNLAQNYGYLVETIDRFVKIFGFDETNKMLEAYEQPPIPSFRVNTLKISVSVLKQRLLKKGFLLKEIDWYTEGFQIEKEPYPLGATTEYLAGYYFIQSVASWLPPLVLNPLPEELVLDLAAAPGGKATHLAQLMNNEGTLICLDISRDRIKALRSNLARCGVRNSILIRKDSRQIPELKLKVKKILLDAPCSGEGLMALDRTRRTSRTIDDIKRMVELQKELLTAALKSLQEDGELVYSTCSTAPEENEEIINWALNEYSIEILETGFNNFKGGLPSAFNIDYHPNLSKARRLYPHINGTEGFFVCKMKLKEEID
ncbi:MAG: RsmB/NOP family class I SAM-dependent RNA methyltransferase [Candidatus Heimdallarchaeota archaeon]|nr:RsmB/NOP family class I SAM-dependent RNA methyltransferase [Candidatus Heimdallarchaeota archaeon]